MAVKQVAVIICNWNKKEYVLKCIDSVKKMNFSDLDIYVVDNASTDGSADAIEELFGKEVTLIRNQENKGGSGGFNTGIKEALKGNYKYLYLLDNDVVVDENALTELYNYMEEDEEAAFTSSTIYVMDDPRFIQEIGSNIDWSTFWVKLNYPGFVHDDRFIPELVNCDVVPACSLLARVDAVKEVGLMDENFFLYWDDIDWSYRMKLKGYKVIGVSKSKVYHKKGITTRKDTMVQYYDLRNRIYFFLKYCPEEKLEQFAKAIFEFYVPAAYFANMKERYSTVRTWLFAIEDALSCERGKARENRIVEKESDQTRLESIVKTCEKDIIVLGTEGKHRLDIFAFKHTVNIIKNMNPNANVIVAMRTTDERLHSMEEQLMEEGIEFIPISQVAELDDKLVIQYSGHISQVPKDPSFQEIANTYGYVVDMYLDSFQNMIYTPEDRMYADNYSNVFKLHEEVYFPIFMQRVKEASKRIKESQGK